jgi:hypothetical protein
MRLRGWTTIRDDGQHLNAYKSRREESSMTFWRTRRPAAGAGAVAAMAIIAALAACDSGSASSPDQAATASFSKPALFRLSAAPLGVNVAPWDSVYTDSRASVIQPLLSAAGIRQLRYGGGSFADYYDWQVNASIEGCLPNNTHASFTSGCASASPLGFAQFARQASAINADKLITLNYGSGTPAEAGDWVTEAKHTKGEGVTLWEIGNESYGCYEVNNELAEPPARYHGYIPAVGSASGDYKTCPQVTEGPTAGMKTLAESYAYNALKFMRAVKEANPSAVIGVPWAFDESVQGSAVTESGEWNNIVLAADGADVNFVDAHWYPFDFSKSTGGRNPTDSQVLRALQAIPSLYASIKAGLTAHKSHAAVVIGETDVSNNPTTTACTPVGAVFAAGDVLSWLAAGAQTVDWWDLNNEGDSHKSCTRPDHGLVTSAKKPMAETPYYGYLLASRLAQPGARFGFMATSNPQVLAFQSALPSGKNVIAFVNLDTGGARTVRVSPRISLQGTLRSLSYSAGQQNAAHSRIVAGTTSAAKIESGISLPAESVTVLETE